MDARLSFTVPTLVEWRRPDGTVLVQELHGPYMLTDGILMEPHTQLLVMEPYEIFARPHDQSADWRRVYEIDPVNRTVARLDL